MRRINFLVILLITIAWVFCYFSYSFGGIEDDPYYDQFKPEYWHEEQRQGVINFFWILVPGLIIWFAYYLSAGKDSVSAIRIFYLLIILAIVIPIIRTGVIKSRITSELNKTQYSRNPIYTMKSYPLEYGMNTRDIMNTWGAPRMVYNSGPLSKSEIVGSNYANGKIGYIMSTNTGSVEEHWIYSRREPRFHWVGGGGSYMFTYFSGFIDYYEVELIFWDGKLINSRPEIENITKGKVPIKADFGSGLAF